MNLSEAPRHLYQTCETTQDAHALAKAVARKWKVFTTVAGCSVFLIEEHGMSERYNGFAAAWEEGERLRGCWNEEEVNRFRNQNAGIPFKTLTDIEREETTQEIHGHARWDFCNVYNPYDQ